MAVVPLLWALIGGSRVGAVCRDQCMVQGHPGGRGDPGNDRNRQGCVSEERLLQECLSNVAFAVLMAFATASERFSSRRDVRGNWGRGRGAGERREREGEGGGGRREGSRE